MLTIHVTVTSTCVTKTQADLQKLLRDNDVAYNTDPREAQGKLFLNIIFSLTHCLRKNIRYRRMLYSFTTLLQDHAK